MDWFDEAYWQPESIAVLISGVASMGLEMLAGRMMAPEFGSSVYTWGSIIGVFMAALAVGYHLGGKRAQKKASLEALTNILVLSALYIGLMITLGENIINASEFLPVGNRYASVIPVTVLFGPPTFLLGFISPYAAELSSKTGKGEASGNVYAIGTFGSILGTFGTTFILLPYLSVGVIQLFFAVFMIAGALFCSRGTKNYSTQISFAVASLVVLSGAFLMQNAAGFGSVYQTQTPYQELEIRDSGNIRTMYLNGQPQSAMYLDGSNEDVWGYTRYFHLPYLMTEEENSIENVLFIGGGGFTGPKRFVEQHNASVDVVELDPEVVKAAKTYFEVNESERLRIHIEDGRRFLEQSNKTYDLIVMDAYRKSSVPFHLTTKEFLELSESKLSGDGFFYANLISAPKGPGSKLFRSEYRTAETVFPRVYAFRTSDLPLTQNIELIASKKEERISREDLNRRNNQRKIGINLSAEISNMMDVESTGDVPMLHDERAPVDRLLEPLVGSEYVIEQSDE